MGVILADVTDQDKDLFLNFWHWGTIVEAIRKLEVIPDLRAQALHEQYIGSGLTKEEALKVASALRSRLLPTLSDDERLLLDGSKTSRPDTGALDFKDTEKNCSTDPGMLRKFAEFCESCSGFTVR